MDKDTLTTKLREAGYPLQMIVRMGDDDGWRLSLTNGTVIHAFDDGRFIVHGPDAASLRLILRTKSVSKGTRDEKLELIGSPS
jgi:hypothetical protein